MYFVVSTCLKRVSAPVFFFPPSRLRCPFSLSAFSFSAFQIFPDTPLSPATIFISSKISCPILAWAAIHTATSWLGCGWNSIDQLHSRPHQLLALCVVELVHHRAMLLHYQGALGLGLPCRSHVFHRHQMLCDPSHVNAPLHPVSEIAISRRT